MMTDEEVKKELLDKIDYMIANVNQWSVRDTLKHFTNYGFWKVMRWLLLIQRLLRR
jgi:hypothetical protein